MTYCFVAEARTAFPVQLLCRAVGVAVSGFYAGLRAHGPRITRKLSACLVGEGALVVLIRRRFPSTTDSRHDQPAVPNRLEQNFAAVDPDPVSLTDTSDIPTAECRLYFAAVEDMVTREIVGWLMADHLRAEPACDTLQMAMYQRQRREGVVHDSDCGVQYTCKQCQAILSRYGLRCSMSRLANCYGNAPMDNFFGSLKDDLVRGTSPPTTEAARRCISGHIEVFCNRRHSGLGLLRPAQG